MILIPYILLCINCLLQGIIDAILYNKLGADSFEWNEHVILAMQRGLLLLIVLSGSLFEFDNIQQSFYDIGVLTIAYCLSFSFFHNWSYGYTKLKIWENPVTLFSAMKYTSKTDTSKYNFNFKERLISFLVALLIIGLDIFLLGC